MVQEAPKLPEGFEVVDAPTLPEGFSVAEDPFVIKSDLPPLERKKMAGHGVLGLKMRDEPEVSYKTRQMEHYGMQPLDSERYDWLLYAAAHTASRGESEADKRRVVEKMLPGAQLKRHEGYGDYVIQMPDGTVTPYDMPGIDKQELLGAAPGGIVMGTEIAGGIGGSGLGPGGVIAGAGLGTYSGERDRLYRGRNLGLNEMSDAQIEWDAAQEAILTVGLDVALAGAGKLMKGVVKKSLRGTMSDAGVDEVMREFTDEQAERIVKRSIEIREKTGVRPSLGQVVADLDMDEKLTENILTLERRLAEGGFSPDLEDVFAEQRRVAKAQKEEVFSEALEGDIAEVAAREAEVGEGIEAVARETVAAEREAVEAQLEGFVRNAHREIDIFHPQGGFAAGRDLQESLSRVNNTLWESLSKRYEGYKEATADIAVDLSPLRAVGEKYRRQIDEMPLPSLADENYRLVKEAGAVKKDTIGEILGEEAVEDTISMDTLLMTLSDVRRESRRVAKGDQSGNLEVLKEIEGALKDARDAALKDADPKLRDDILALENDYARAKQDIEKTVIGDVVATTSSPSRFDVSAENVSAKLLQDSNAIKLVKQIADDPEYASENIAGRMKNSILADYKDKVLQGRVRAETWEINNRDAMDAFLTKAERDSLKSPAKARKYILDQEKSLEKLNRDIDKSFGGRVAEMDTEDVFKHVSGDRKRAAQLKTMLKDHPELWDQYKSVRMREVMESVSTDEGIIGRVPSGNKIRSFLNKNKSEMVVTYGEDFVRELDGLSKILDMTGPFSKKFRSSYEELMREMPAQTPAVAAFRATVARPLSRMGLLTTAVMKLNRAGVRKGLGKVMADPEGLKRYMSLVKQKNAPIKRFVELFKSVGAYQLASELEDMATGE